MLVHVPVTEFAYPWEGGREHGRSENIKHLDGNS